MADEPQRPSENPPAAPSTSAIGSNGLRPDTPRYFGQQTNTAAADVYAQLLEYELDFDRCRFAGRSLPAHQSINYLYLKEPA